MERETETERGKLEGRGTSSRTRSRIGGKTGLWQKAGMNEAVGMSESRILLNLTRGISLKKQPFL